MSNDRDEQLGEVHEHLRLAGERWRADRMAAMPTLDASLFEPSARPRGRGARVVLSLAGALGAVALVALVLALRPPTDRTGVAPTDSSSTTASPPASPQPTADQTATAAPQPTAQPTATRDPVIREGDAVVGVGYVVRFADGNTRLCGWGPVPANMALHCAQPSVEVVLDSPEQLPGWGPEFDGAASDWLQVRGRWQGGALYVDAFTTAERPPELYPRRTPPCDPPAGGWPGNADDAESGEAAGLALHDLIDADPALYSGIGITFPGSRGSDAVPVVGTVGDVDEVGRHLAEIYPYNLCVIAVDYSRADLEPITQRLLDHRWTANIDAIEGHVEAWLPLLDEAATAVLGDDADKVVVRALLEKVAHP